MRVQIEDEWNGWDGDTIVELTNGRFFRQTDYHYEYMYAYRPLATLEDGKLHVDGMSGGIRVHEISPVVSNVRGEWTGWDGETVVELDNGQVLVESITDATGSVGNPMRWPQLDAKFMSLTRPALGSGADELLDLLHSFGDPGSASRLFTLTSKIARRAG